MVREEMWYLHRSRKSSFMHQASENYWLMEGKIKWARMYLQCSSVNKREAWRTLRAHSVTRWAEELSGRDGGRRTITKSPDDGYLWRTVGVAMFILQITLGGCVGNICCKVKYVLVLELPLFTLPRVLKYLFMFKVGLRLLLKDFCFWRKI